MLGLLCAECSEGGRPDRGMGLYARNVFSLRVDLMYSVVASPSVRNPELCCTWGTLFVFGDSEMALVTRLSVKVVLS